MCIRDRYYRVVTVLAEARTLEAAMGIADLAEKVGRKVGWRNRVPFERRPGLELVRVRSRENGEETAFSRRPFGSSLKLGSVSSLSGHAGS